MNDRQRRTLAAFAEVLVPGADLAHAERALAAVPELWGPLAGVLDRLADEPPRTAVPRLEREEPRTFNLLFLVVAGGYLLDADVRRRLGYPGQEAVGLPGGGAVAGEDLLEPVLARGRRWRGDETGEV